MLIASSACTKQMMVNSLITGVIVGGKMMHDVVVIVNHCMSISGAFCVETHKVDVIRGCHERLLNVRTLICKKAP